MSASNVLHLLLYQSYDQSHSHRGGFQKDLLNWFTLTIIGPFGISKNHRSFVMNSYAGGEEPPTFRSPRLGDVCLKGCESNIVVVVDTTNYWEY